MTRYGLKKIWDSDVRATRSRTFTLYNYIYKVLVDDSLSSAGHSSYVGPALPHTTRSRHCDHWVHPRAVRGRPLANKYLYNTGAGAGAGGAVAGLDNTGEPRRLGAAAPGAAAASVQRRAQRRASAQRPVQPQARQRQRQRAHARQSRPARTRLARLLLAAPAVVEESLHAAHARGVVHTRLGAAQTRAAAQPARGQRPRPRALLAAAPAARLAHYRLGGEGAGAPLVARGGRLRRHRLERLVRARVGGRGGGRGVRASRGFHVSIALALHLGPRPQQRYCGLARARRPVDARRWLGRPGRRRRPAILIHRVRLTALRAVAFLFPHRRHLHNNRQTLC